MILKTSKLALIFFIFLLISPSLLASNSHTEAMNNERLHKLIKRIDLQAKGQLGYWQIQYKNIPVFIITDENANRMRIISPIESAESINRQKLYRMMQANFDSALDARYSIAKDKLWSAYIHPLDELSTKNFILV